MAKIERHVIDCASDEDDRLAARVRQSKLVKDIRILACQFGEQYLRLVHLLPNLLHDRTGVKQIVGTHRLETSLLDRRLVELLVVAVVPAAERHKHEARVEEFASRGRLGAGRRSRLRLVQRNLNFLRRKALQDRLAGRRCCEGLQILEILFEDGDEVLKAITRDLEVARERIRKILVFGNRLPGVVLGDFLEQINLFKRRSERLLSLLRRTRRNDVCADFLQTDGRSVAASRDKPVLVG
ncbi:MAG: hypothetical protein IPM64_12495 [Phycisphaerales bacterium]|nr:hypothetical protein [Phycisphaerales bacterium]